MIQSDEATGLGTTTSNLSYDVDDNRITKTVDDNGTQSSLAYVMDNNQDYAQVLHEVDASTFDTQVSYTYGDDLLAQDRAGLLQIYHYDGLGSTRLLTDSSENTTDSYNYEAFEDLLNQEGFSENNYLFTGEQYDTELDQYYLRARYYDQKIGRFPSMDSWMGNGREPITLNKYVYANNDPSDVVDPSGKIGIGLVLSTIRGVAINTTRATINYSRFIANRVNQTSIRKVESLRAKIWLVRTIGRVQSRLPKSFGRGNPNKKGTGWRWNDGKGNGIRIDRGNPKSSLSSQKVDHVIVNSGGKIIGRNGKPIGGSIRNNPTEAHIPLYEWLFWRSWNKF